MTKNEFYKQWLEHFAVGIPPKDLKKYVDFFNKNDEESYHNLIPNDRAYEWLKDEIPLFFCPDKDIEKAYYFRWWTYRKHLRLTDDGYIITEFLPPVPWSGKHNEINAAVGHHIYEGRWLKNGKKYLSDYIRFFLDNPDRGHQYSAWLADALLRLCEVSGDYTPGEELLLKLVSYYEVYHKTVEIARFCGELGGLKAFPCEGRGTACGG